jgi:hypothetical protein
MQIKITKGYGDTQHIEVLKEISLDDFIIQEDSPIYCEYSKRVSINMELILKDEVADRIQAILPDAGYYSKEEFRTKWSKSYGREIKFNGCRSEEAREVKIEKTRIELAGEHALRKEDRIEKILSMVRRDLEIRIERSNEDYESKMMEVFEGRNLKKEWMEEHLDDASTVSDLADINAEIEKLKAKRDELDEELRVKRNDNMLAYLDENGWNDDEDGEKIYVTQEMRDRITEMYKNHEAFQSRKRQATFF